MTYVTPKVPWNLRPEDSGITQGPGGQDRPGNPEKWQEVLSTQIQSRHVAIHSEKKSVSLGSIIEHLHTQEALKISIVFKPSSKGRPLDHFRYLVPQGISWATKKNARSTSDISHGGVLQSSEDLKRVSNHLVRLGQGCGWWRKRYFPTMLTVVKQRLYPSVI